MQNELYTFPISLEKYIFKKQFTGQKIDDKNESIIVNINGLNSVK